MGLKSTLIAIAALWVQNGKKHPVLLKINMPINSKPIFGWITFEINN